MLIAAFLWGLAEATLFFIVPDVLFTYLVLFDAHLALQSCLYALAGALLGGAGMYLWGRKNSASAEQVVEALPGISKKLMEREKNALKRKGLSAILLGPLKGVPYKIYAISAPKAGVSFFRFLLISVPARLIRFILATLGADLAFHRILPEWNLTVQLSILSGFWLIFYIWYFVQMRNLSR